MDGDLPPRKKLDNEENGHTEESYQKAIGDKVEQDKLAEKGELKGEVDVEVINQKREEKSQKKPVGQGVG